MSAGTGAGYRRVALMYRDAVGEYLGALGGALNLGRDERIKVSEMALRLLLARVDHCDDELRRADREGADGFRRELEGM